MLSRFALFPLPALLLLPSLALSQNTSKNLLAWNKWTKIQGQYIKNLKITRKQISFSPYFNGYTKKTTGLMQTVFIPKTGTYQLHFRGVGGLTGSFYVQVKLGGKTKAISADNWKVATTYELKKGSHVLKILTDTSNLLVDTHIWHQPLLLPAPRPTVDVERWNFPPYNGRKFRVVLRFLSQKGNLVLMGLRPLQTPLHIPGIGYGLLLDPKSRIFLLGFQARPGIQLDFSPFAWKQIPFPRVYLQAMTLNPLSFGALSWVEYAN